MSDVLVAPDVAPPAGNEVPINQNPVSSPQPLGPQAPPAPVEDLKGAKARPESRREAIQKAFDKAGRTEPAAAKPKIGHNRPPEETPPDKPQQQPQQREVHREGGRFARAPNAQQQPGTQAQPGQQRPATTPLPANDPYREPPSRWVDEAKTDWAAAPATVRGEVHRMAQEFDGAYRKYRGDHDTMNSIRHFHEMAQQHGTTLDRALTNYVSMEQKLRSDLVGGLDVIVNNLGLTTPDGQRISLRDVAYHVLSQSPEQLKQVQQGNAQQAASHQIGALHQELSGLKNQLHQMHTQQQFVHTRSAVDQFADAHPRFDELGDLIEHELQFGFDLQTAYQRAELLRPASHTAQTRDPSNPAQTRSDKSIFGAPDSGPSNGKPRRDGKPIGRREAIQDAIRRVNGGV